MSLPASYTLVCIEALRGALAQYQLASEVMSGSDGSVGLRLSEPPPETAISDEMLAARVTHFTEALGYEWLADVACHARETAHRHPEHGQCVGIYHSALPGGGVEVIFYSGWPAHWRLDD